MPSCARTASPTWASWAGSCTSPAEFALHVFDRIVDAGARHGLKLAGFHAMNACRTEKGYRHWGHDIGIEDTPLEAGLAFTCAWDKPGGFIGREALLRHKAQGVPHKRLLQFKLHDPMELLHHEEPLFADGQPVGVITSGMYGHRVDASLGMGYVRRPHAVTPDWIAATRFEGAWATGACRPRPSWHPGTTPRANASDNERMNPIDYTVSDGIAQITLAHPPVNALTRAHVDDLITALRRAAADDAARAVVLASAVPGRFCAGLDLKALHGQSATTSARCWTRCTLAWWKRNAPWASPASPPSTAQRAAAA